MNRIEFGQRTHYIRKKENATKENNVEANQEIRFQGKVQRANEDTNPLSEEFLSKLNDRTKHIYFCRSVGTP